MAAASAPARSVEHGGGRVIVTINAPLTGELLTSGYDSCVRVHDPATATTVRTVGRNDGVCWCLAPLPASDRVVCGLYDGLIRLESLTAATDAPLATYRGHDGRVVDAAVATSEGTFVTGGRDERLWLWDAAREAPKTVLHAHRDDVNDLALLSEQLLASASDDRTVAVWDIRTNVRASTMLVASQAFRIASQPGDTIAVGLFSGAIELLDLRAAGSGEGSSDCKIGELEGHTKKVFGLTNLYDGRLASSSFDKTVRIWDVAACSRVATFEAPDDLTRCCVTSDGQLAVGCYDGRTYLYGGWAWSRRCEAAAAWEAAHEWFGDE